MFEAIFMAATGLTNQQRRLDTIADNIANANTVGFKTARLDFKDALYTAGISPGPSYTPEGNLQKGHGVMSSTITKDFQEGNIINSDNKLDFALEGDGFFAITDSAGNNLYTRAGNFYTSVQENGTFIVNSQGYYVQNIDGSNIQIPDDTTDIVVDTNGAITFYSGDAISGTDRFALYTFTNKTGLGYSGASNFVETDSSGDRLESDARVRQYALESSNINLASEMTRIIRTQRAFSLASRCLSTGDEMEGIANNMRK